MFVQYHNWGNIYKMWNNCEGNDIAVDPSIYH